MIQDLKNREYLLEVAIKEFGGLESRSNFVL